MGSLRLNVMLVKWIYIFSLMPPSAQCSNPVVCGWRETAVGGGGGVRVGGHTYWSTNDFNTFRPAPERTQSLLGGCFYLLLSVVWPDFLQRMRRLLAVSALLWEFMLHLEMHECRYDKHGPLRGPWPCWLLHLPWHQPHTEQPPTPQCHNDECLCYLYAYIWWKCNN